MAPAKDLMAPTKDNGRVKKMEEEEKRTESTYQNQKGDKDAYKSLPKLPETGNAAVDEEEEEEEASAGNKDRGLCCRRVRRVAAVKDVVEYQPPKSLVIVWTLMAAELGFNLTTSVIAFISTVGTAYCCDEQIYLGPLPLSTTIPFFFLILTELAFLTRAILLTLFPSKFGHQQQQGTSTSSSSGGDISNDDDDVGQGFEVKMQSTDVDQESNDDDKEQVDSGNKRQQRSHDEPQYVDRTQHRSSQHQQEQPFCRRFFCCCLKWNAKMVLTVLNFLTLANPFFGCVIAWMLLYQSDKAEAFVVLGLEGISIILHFVSVRLEGGLRTWYSKLIHSVSLLPFLITVITMLVYLREGGVCYVVEEELFKFSGCEVCDDMTPPVDGMCGDAALEGTGGIFGEVQNLELSNLAALADGGAKQDSYCSESINFCWYPF